jgi:outer membrane autotransporter protein
MTDRSVGASIGGKLRCAFQSKPLLLVLLGGTCLSPVGAAAQTTNWLGGTSAYNNGANWTAGVPAAGDTAIFSNVGSANVTNFGGATDVGTWQFQPGASAYTFTVDSSLGFRGSGIVNNSSNAPTITNVGFAFIGFANSATAGNARITNNSFVEFADTSTAGTATITNNGAVTFAFNSTAGSATIVNAGSGSLISFTDTATAGNATITTNSGTLTQFTNFSSGGQARLITNAGGQVDISGLLSGGMSAGSIEGAGDYFLGANQLTVGSNNLSTTVSGTVNDGGSFGGTGGSLVKVGTGTLTLTGANTYTGGTTVTGGLINFAAASNFGSGMITLNGGGLQWATGNTIDISAQLAPLGAGGGTVDTNGNNVTFATGLSGPGGLTKAGAGTLTLNGTSSYSGGTMVTGGTLAGTTASLQGNIVNNAVVAFNQAGSGTYGGVMSGTGSLTKIDAGTLILTGANTYSGGTTVSGGILQGNPQSLQGNILNNASVVFNQTGSGTYGGAMSGTGNLTLQGGGLLNLTGANSFTGGTTVTGGTLAVNGSLAGAVTVGSAGTLGGSGTVTGNVVNAGTLAPGNSIGTLTVSGSYTQAAGSLYQVEANAAGQADRVNVGGTAVIQGGTVQVLAQPGNYGPSTTYTIVRATGGVSGVYSGVSSNFAFLTPSLSYDANDVFLTLSIAQNAFSMAAVTPNQRAVGTALNQSFANASADFATVIGALAGLNTQQGPLALDTISGQPYADFGTMNTNNAALFMNALGQQMAGARGASSGGQRQALAQACEIAACDAASPLSAWASALGGLGSVLGDGNASTLTYNFGGAAAGIDYRLDPRFLVGIGVGYSHGTQWVNSFMGQGWSDSVSVAAYGSFTQAGFYVDALAGYAYYNNQLQRQILIPGLQQRTATGSTGANQFLGQAETGYKLAVYAPASATVTPFGRLQVSSVTQNAFSESGAQSLSLNVAQQTTNSVRTTIGADLGASIGIGDTKTVDLALRLGWLHEFADTGRPITAAFAGAPGNSFTVFGATPLRNAAVVGLQATTTIAAATQIYLRYDGEIATGTDNHALNVGVRMSW